MDSAAVHTAIRATFGLHRATDNLPWAAVRRYTRANLATVFATCAFTHGAEIGVRRGRFSEWLCRQVPHLTLLCIDPWSAYNNKYPQARQDGIYTQAVARLSQCPGARIIRKSSMDALADVPDDSLDFVFIDGDHHFDHVAPDIICWSRKVHTGGIVAVHDYYAFGWAGVMHAVNGYVASHDIRPWYVTKELEPTAFWVRP